MYIPHLVTKVIQLLDDNDRYIKIYILNRLTYIHCTLLCKLCRTGRLKWHGVIPPDEVWVKIGGDKGGGSFKMNFQIVNVSSPNSPQNTCVFCCFEASDSITNLHIALDRFRPQVEQLQSMKWR